MEFKYYVYFITGGIIVSLAIYALQTRLFSAIRFKKQVIEVEFSETLIIPELAELGELGEFTYNKSDKELQNEIVFPFWLNYKIDPLKGVSSFALNFESDDKTLSADQLLSLRKIIDYSSDNWLRMLNQILGYYNEYYSDIEELDDLSIVDIEDLQNSIQLNGIFIHRTGSIGLLFDCIWDEEHGLGVRIDEHEIEIGEASEAY